MDFSKHTKGDVATIFCCDDCTRHHGLQPKRPADSRGQSWACDVCGHRGIGSARVGVIGDWLRIRPVQGRQVYAWPDGVWCELGELEEYLAPPCAKSDDCEPLVLPDDWTDEQIDDYITRRLNL